MFIKTRLEGRPRFIAVEFRQSSREIVTKLDAIEGIDDSAETSGGDKTLRAGGAHKRSPNRYPMQGNSRDSFGVSYRFVYAVFTPCAQNRAHGQG
jgi:hypothetical protein